MEIIVESSVPDVSARPMMEQLGIVLVQLGMVRNNARDGLAALADGDAEGARRYLVAIQKITATQRPARPAQAWGATEPA